MRCPRCNTDDPGVYVGLTTVECTNPQCAVYSPPEAPSELQAHGNNTLFTGGSDPADIDLDHFSTWEVRIKSARDAPLVSLYSDGRVDVAGTYLCKDANLCRRFSGWLVACGVGVPDPSSNPCPIVSIKPTPGTDESLDGSVIFMNNDGTSVLEMKSPDNIRVHGGQCVEPWSVYFAFVDWVVKA